MHGKRQQALRKAIRDLDIDCLVVSKLENIFYLCGFTGTTGLLLVEAEKTTLIADPRYSERAEEESKEVHMFNAGNVWKGLLEVLKRHELRRVGYEEHAVTVEDLGRLEQKALQGGLEAALKPTGRLVETLRMTKDETEIETIKTACDITSSGFHLIVDFLVEGTTEREIASELYCFMYRNGVNKAAFEVIVAAGERSAMPHAALSDRKLKKGDLVLIDMGVCYRGYFSDMTRTFSLGPADDTKRSIYKAVLRALTEALEGIKPGMTGGECDALSRRVLEKDGYDRDFIHGLGHGVGLEVHEGPALAPDRKETIGERMVFTVEPGVYKKGLGGVRIEDTVVMKSNGVEVLTDFTKELIEL